MKRKLSQDAEYVLDLLVAAGHISRETAFQARDIAIDLAPGRSQNQLDALAAPLRTLRVALRPVPELTPDERALHEGTSKGGFTVEDAVRVAGLAAPNRTARNSAKDADGVAAPAKGEPIERDGFGPRTPLRWPADGVGVAPHQTFPPSDADALQTAGKPELPNTDVHLADDCRTARK